MAVGDTALATAIGITDRALVVAAFAARADARTRAQRACRARERRALAMRSISVSTVTHELKTPIATIRAIGDTIVGSRNRGRTRSNAHIC